jgi:hypothetical protein
VVIARKFPPQLIPILITAIVKIRDITSSQPAQ